jgi:hypothetical protein
MTLPTWLVRVVTDFGSFLSTVDVFDLMVASMHQCRAPTAHRATAPISREALAAASWCTKLLKLPERATRAVFANDFAHAQNRRTDLIKPQRANMGITTMRSQNRAQGS